jgi:hypothetical protein
MSVAFLCEEETAAETIAVVLSVGNEHTETFERRFRTHEVPVWDDLRLRGGGETIVVAGDGNSAPGA